MNNSSANITLFTKLRSSEVKFAIIALSCLFFSALNAQTDSYSCDFENQTENDQWVLNAGAYGPSRANRWYIGAPGNNGGDNGLYISGDNGVSTNYVGTPTFVTVYREITLDAGDYELSFDWQAWGISNDALYVAWVPATVDPVSSGNPFPQKWFEDNPKVSMDGLTKLQLSPWNTVKGVISSDGKPRRLVFSWQNEFTPKNPAASIDNINIIPVPNTSCAQPEDLDLIPSASTLNISWKGGATSYDLRMLMSDGSWREYNNLTSKTHTENDIPEGGVYVYVRSNCGTYQSAWKSSSAFVFEPGNRCLEFLDLQSAYCYSGLISNLYMSRQNIDDGYKAITSRQTVHYDVNEKDPRTAMNLSTVPEGEVASVRLGNWDINRGAEGIEYNYHVDDDESAVFLLKYAVVMQDPKHPRLEQPHFMLKILHNGSSIGAYKCGEADFYSGDNLEGWDSIRNLIVDNIYDVILYKHWTTIGINLKDYVGEDLLIRLNTFDCGEGGHYGYSYFSLGCSDGRILGLSCGESEKNSFQAPEGFKYRWYLEADPTITLGTEQIFSVDKTDTLMYCCDVIQLTEENCYYTIYANAVPRYPVAKMEYQIQPDDCNNIVKFTDQSYVLHVNPFTNDTTRAEGACDSIVWDFGNGVTSRERNPTHIFPEDQGTYQVTLKAYLVECENQYTFDIVLPQAGTTRDTIYEVACNGAYVEFAGKNLYDTGWYSDTVFDYKGEGCDSISTLYLRAITINDTTVYDTVCSGDLPYEFLGEEYSAEGEYSHTLTSVDGCDSVVILNLKINGSLSLSMTENVSACADDESILIPISISGGEVSSFEISITDKDEEIASITGTEFDGTSAVVTMPDNIRPGYYRANAVFNNRDCGDVSGSVEVTIYYPNSVITQRWNDVLGVRNSAYNGGYEFSAYQWYKNGESLGGETSSNLYLPEGLDTDAEYGAMLTRADDGVSVMTCPIVPQNFGDIAVTPTVTITNGSIEVKSYSNGTARLWSVTGQLIKIVDIKGNVASVKAPNIPGAYILEIILNDGNTKTEKIVVY